MKKNICLLTIIFFSISFLQAQEKEKKEKKSVKEVINELPDMLIAQPDAGPDTNANKLINDNMSIVIPPLWREKGLHTLLEFKVPKTNVEPLLSTFPLPDKKIAQGLVVYMSTIKKPAAEKKQSVLAQIKNHITAYYKEAGLSISAQELTDKTNEMIISTEAFTTGEGKQGELYVLHDIQTNQSNLVVLLLIAGVVPNTTNYVQFNYTRYTYETNLPEDLMELKMFVYPDEQDAYVGFTKGILKTLRIK
ncbi:MAG: hypothetical protein V4615_01090 [Bacteroidota bacterium]